MAHINAVTEKAHIKRDEIVFHYAFNKNVPIVMVFGGGYQKNNARIIADSITNLDRQFKLF